MIKMKKFYYIKLTHATIEKDFASVAQAEKFAKIAKLAGYKLETREAWNALGRLSRT
jgi:hypothetical protein